MFQFGLCSRGQGVLSAAEMSRRGFDECARPAFPASIETWAAGDGLLPHRFARDPPSRPGAARALIIQDPRSFTRSSLQRLAPACSPHHFHGSFEDSASARSRSASPRARLRVPASDLAIKLRPPLPNAGAPWLFRGVRRDRPRFVRQCDPQEFAAGGRGHVAARVRLRTCSPCARRNRPLKQIECRKASPCVRAVAPGGICAIRSAADAHRRWPGRDGEVGELKGCEFINVESEFAALSVAIGASAAGARSYTATASQGILYMAEAVYNAAGLGLPIVMTIGNRAIGAPINIWNDHSDSMALRDAGGSSSPETNQEAPPAHQRSASPELSFPLCVVAASLTHAYYRIDIPPSSVDAYLRPSSRCRCSMADPSQWVRL